MRRWEPQREVDVAASLGMILVIAFEHPPPLLVVESLGALPPPCIAMTRPQPSAGFWPTCRQR